MTDVEAFVVRTTRQMTALRAMLTAWLLEDAAAGEDDPAFAEAVGAVLAGIDGTLDAAEQLPGELGALARSLRGVGVADAA